MKLILYLANSLADVDLPNDLLCNLITRHIQTYQVCCVTGKSTVYMYVAHTKQYTS